MVELNLGTNQLTTLPGDISNLLNLEVNGIIIMPLSESNPQETLDD